MSNEYEAVPMGHEESLGVISIQVEALSEINYALFHNAIPVIRRVTLRNGTDKPITGATLEIVSQPAFCLPSQWPIDCLPAGEPYAMRRVALQPDVDYLASMTERVDGVLQFRLVKEGDLLAQEQVPMTALAFDQWHGSGVHPEMLASFVTPNHPVLATVFARAAVYLSEWTGDPSFDGYQSHDADRVRKQAAALYCALKEQKIVYCNPPAGFETGGQRVRLCDAVLKQKIGTCLDLTLLYVSCLEAIGIHPLMILKPGHIFTGFWLEELSFPETVQSDPSMLTKRLADGVNEIAVVESVCIADGNDASFDDAEILAQKQLIGDDPIDYIIDVKRARMSRVLPLPQRVHDDEGWHIEFDEPETNAAPTAPRSITGGIDVSDVSDACQVPKIVQWERKLLDLGMRNTLINLRFTKTIVPLLAESLDELEDALAQGRDFTVLACPEEWAPAGARGFESVHDLGAAASVIRADYAQQRLRSALHEKELTQVMKTLYRNSKNAIEENGANTLFLAMGLLRWYETPRSKMPRYAPLILLPMEMVRRAGNKGYTLRLRDDDPQINVTILEKIKQDFDIQVKGLDPLPYDDNGIDIRKIFTIVRQAIMGQERWDVLESAYLGQFSFSQFVMWNDIRHRTDDLRRNKIVQSLIEGKLMWDARPMDPSGYTFSDSVLLPLPADASQLYAIEAACRSESFVLHGPPGTGKSQTITSLIANALAQGKTVLFVAEKKAALDVVQKRLEDIGIGPFCMELHSNKAKKREVLDHLRRVTELTRHRTPAQFQERVEQIQALRRDLDQYAVKLHREQPCGFSLFELINAYEEVADSPDVDGLVSPGQTMPDRRTMEDTVLLLERLTALGKPFDALQEHPLSRVGADQYSQTLRRDAKTALDAYRAALGPFATATRDLVTRMGMDVNNMRTGACPERACDFASWVLPWDGVPAAWRMTEDPNTFFFNIIRMAELFRHARELSDQIAKQWNADIFTQTDISSLLASVEQMKTKWFLPRFLDETVLKKTLEPFAKGAFKREDIVPTIRRLGQWKSETQAAQELFAVYGASLGTWYTDDTTDWDMIIRRATQVRVSSAELAALTGSFRFQKEELGDAACLQAAATITEMFPAVRHRKEEVYRLLAVREQQVDDWMQAELAMCDGVSAHLDELKEWTAFNGVAAEARNANLGAVVDAYIGGMPAELVIPTYRKAVLYQLIVTCIDADGLLNNFSGLLFNEKVEQFKRIDRELMALTREEIFCRLAAAIPEFTTAAAQSSELGVLQRMIKSGGRGVSIRKMIEQLPVLLPRLCPCMLMSPISAAQYLDPKREPFDIVVFDEASQLPTCKAVGVLARGRDAVVVGDPKQMPPTSFFAVNTLDEDNLDAEDLESILDDCLALNMPQTHLLWHYRSRHESLISFSNTQFYENRLFTFPSVNDRESKVSLVHVDGVFERGKTRCNRAEAEAVVAEICRRCHDPILSKLSVGVITFNISQQHLIDDLLNEACENDPVLERWVYESSEPLFIKNLENVQGDEREVILFSVGYGPDENGKVYMNFGPLNRDGGWRRLNVAVSRARSEMIVFSTLTADQIDLSKSSALGVAALKAFLVYAAGERLPVTQEEAQQSGRMREGVAKRICAMLREHGLQTQCSVGRSGYRVDIGVIDPEYPERYILGILLDGESYGSARTTRDREVAQVGILQGLGWHVLRIWTMDWWDNRHKEIRRILDEVERLLRERREPTSAVDTTEDREEATVSADVPPEDLPATEAEQAEETTSCVVVPFVAAALTNDPLTTAQLISPEHTYDVVHTIQQIVADEAPIYHTHLVKKVLRSFGVPMSSAKGMAFVEGHLSALDIVSTEDEDGRCYWHESQDPATYALVRCHGEASERRDPEDLPMMERLNAVCYIVDTQIGIPREDLVREAARLFGYPRATATVTAPLFKAVQAAEERGWMLCDDSGMCRLTEEGQAFAARFHAE